MAAYNDLNIDRSLIECVINNNLEGSTLNKKSNPNGFTYTFQFQTGIKTATLHVYSKANGKTTLHYGQGKNPEFSQKVADIIKENCSIKEYPFNQLYFRLINTKEFEFLLSYMLKIGELNETKQIPTGTQYKYKGKLGEELSIIKYNNNSIHIQGKSSILFNETVDLLVDIFPPNEVLTGQLNYYNITTPEQEIKTEFDTLYPITSASINERLKSIITPSIALKRVHMVVSDYSFMAFPALRGLEGVMKSIFLANGVTITNSDGFKSYFVKNQTTLKFDPSELTTSTIQCTKSCEALSEMYNQLHKNRHTLFHVDTFAPRILNIQEAFGLIDSTMNIIETSFVSINK